MSRVKIVRKHGKLIRKKVRRSLESWRDDILHNLAPQAYHHYASDTSLSAALLDDDFLIYAILVGGNFSHLREDITTRVHAVHDARGFEFRLTGDSYLLRHYHTTLIEVLQKSHDRLKLWNYAIDFSYEADPDTHFSSSHTTLVLRFYPPLDTVTYAFCKEIPQKLPHGAYYTGAGALKLFNDVGNSVMTEKKEGCKTKSQDVVISMGMKAAVSPAATFHNLLRFNDEIVEP
jgi:hypothetical protein